MKTAVSPQPKAKNSKKGRYETVEAFRKAKLQEAIEETKNVNWEELLREQKKHL